MAGAAAAAAAGAGADALGMGGGYEGPISGIVEDRRFGEFDWLG
jgi:hypothetical protein